MGGGPGKRANRKRGKAWRQEPSRPRRSARWIVWPIVVVVVAWGIGSFAGRVARKPPAVAEGERTISAPARRPGARPAQSLPDYDPPQTFAGLQEESYQVVTELLARLPGDAEAFAKAAQLAGIFGDKELATHYWRQSVAVAPNFMSARYALAWFALRDGRYSEMANQSRQALAVAPEAHVFRDLLGCALIELGEPEEALGALQPSVDQNIATCDTYTLLGKACLVQRDYRRAAEYFELALEKDPNWSKAIYGLATACARIGRTEQAKRSFEKFRQMQTKRAVGSSEDQLQAARRDVATVYRGIASLYAHREDTMNSERLLTRSVLLDPSNDAGQQALRHLQGSISDPGAK